MQDREEGRSGGWTRPVQTGVLVAAVIVPVILSALVSSQARRLSAVARGVRANREEIGRLSRPSDDSQPDRRGVESDLGELRASVRELESATQRLGGKLAAFERSKSAPSDDGGLSRSMADLTKIVRELSDELAEVRQRAERRPAGAQSPVVPAPQGVSVEDLVALADRVAKLEAGADELEKLVKERSDGSSKPRINEEALRALVRKFVDEEIENALREMRERFRRPRIR